MRSRPIRSATVAILFMALATPVAARAAEPTTAELLRRIEALEKELAEVKAQAKEAATRETATSPTVEDRASASAGARASASAGAKLG